MIDFRQVLMTDIDVENSQPRREREPRILPKGQRDEITILREREFFRRPRFPSFHVKETRYGIVYSMGNVAVEHRRLLNGSRGRRYEQLSSDSIAQ